MFSQVASIADRRWFLAALLAFIVAYILIAPFQALPLTILTAPMLLSVVLVCAALTRSAGIEISMQYYFRYAAGGGLRLRGGAREIFVPLIC